jgi:hypothetical protein
MAKKAEGKRGTINCLACGAIAFRRDSRRTLSPKAPQVKLFVCEGRVKHQMEAVLYIVHTDVLGQPKKIMHKYSTKGAGATAAREQDDYDV